MFKGSIVAIVTPFTADGELDEAAFERLIEFQLENGTEGIVPCGTTGESATLSHAEHERVIELAVKIVNKRVPVIAGTGSNSTAEALRLTMSAKASGADGALVITPYYNKPTQVGLYEHFKRIAQSVDLPIVLYNVPGRTGVNMLPSTVARLAELDNIVAIKEASGSLTQMTEILSLCGNRISLLSGDDFVTLPVLAIGGKGIISVVANVVPDKVAKLVSEFEAGDVAGAARLQLQLFPLCQAMFYETNPIPVKTALSLMGKIEGGLRPPLCPMSPENLAKLKNTLSQYGLV
jgi:4-hydroxy-tetrahydrodipicolinate synthase